MYFRVGESSPQRLILTHKLVEYPPGKFHPKLQVKKTYSTRLTDFLTLSKLMDFSKRGF